MKATSSPGRILLLSFILIFLLSCEKENPDVPHPVSLEKLTGHVQKGPFLNGTSITVSELNADMGQSGKNFSTQISDNLGNFELRKVELSSQFVELKADGFYYNEVLDESSSARLVLYALSDLTDKGTLNVNLLSHLEKDRVYNLMDQGMSFSEAKSRAQNEILAMFSLTMPGMEASELLDITQPGDEHAVLLAISLILQGHRTVAELSQLLGDINTDFREDGILDNEETGSKLVNDAKHLNLAEVRDNLESRYAETGLELNLPDFEKYIALFLKQTAFESTLEIVFPQFSDYGENILFGEKTEFSAMEVYSMAASIPRGQELMIKLSGGLWGIRISPDGPVNWRFSTYDFESESQNFWPKESGKDCDMKIQFDPSHDGISSKNILVEYFFITSADTIYHSKTLHISP